MFRRRDTASTEKAQLGPTRQRDKNAIPPLPFFPDFILRSGCRKQLLVSIRYECGKSPVSLLGSLSLDVGGRLCAQGSNHKQGQLWLSRE